MKLKTVIYSGSYRIVSYGREEWEKIEAHVEAEEGETILDCKRKLREQILEAHHETLTDIESYKGTTVKDITPDEPVDKVEPIPLLEQIESCTEVKVLESYRLIAKVKPEYQEAYDKKLKELKND